jgi:hypothetical protein
MTDNEVMAIIISTLRSGLTSYSGLTVQQSYQPTDQGVPEGPALFVHGVIDRPYGYIAARTTYNDGDGDFDFVESEGVLNTFQVSALMPDDVGNVAALTAKDLCNSARGLLQLRSTVQALRSSGLGIARISQTRILHFTNDSGRSEEMPSFDFDVNYARVVSTTKVPAVTGLDYDSVVIDRV